MRWALKGAEPVLQLRCIELNGDWDQFVDWATTKSSQDLASGKGVQIRHSRPKPSAESPLKHAA